MHNLMRALFVAAALAQSAEAQQLPSGIAIGRHAPSAAVRTLDGRTTTLGQYIGRMPVVVEFWAKWCGNCRQLEPSLQSAARTYHGRVTFVTIAVSVDETPGDVARYAHQHRFDWPVVYDATGAAVDAYDVPGTSFLVVIDKTGTVIYTGAGGTQDIDAAVRKAL